MKPLIAWAIFALHIGIAYEAGRRDRNTHSFGAVVYGVLFGAWLLALRGLLN